MALTSDDFYNQLQDLLPPGPAWDVEQSVNAKQLLLAWATEFARVQADIDRLIDETDPRTTSDLLPDYERIFGLPTDCTAGTDLTLQQRRAALVSQMTSTGGQSRAYFIALAAAVGYTITITEFRPHTVMSDVTVPIYGIEWAHIWQVNNSNNPPPQYLTVQGAVNEPLAVWAGNLLTCLFNRLKPAHTQIIFA